MTVAMTDLVSDLQRENAELCKLDELQAENKELRKLVRVAASRCMDFLCDGCPYNDDTWCIFADCAEKLGIEVGV